MASDTIKNPNNTLAYWGGIRPLQRRLGRLEMIERNRDGIAAELLSLGLASVTDIVSWGDDGKLKIKASKDIPLASLKAIKKVKCTAETRGDVTTHTIEFEMWDKVSALRVLARAAGLLDNPDDESDKPSVIGINLMGGGEPVTTYKEVEDEDGDGKDL